MTLSSSEAPMIPFRSGEPLVVRRVFVEARHMVYVKAVLEGYEGQAGLFSRKGGVSLVYGPLPFADELDAILRELSREVSLRFQEWDEPGEPR